MNTTFVRATDIPSPTAARGEEVARTQRLLLLEEALRVPPSQWTARTECPRWTVFDIVAHVASAARKARWPFRFVTDGLIGKLRYPGDSPLDAGNEVAIDRHRGHPIPRLVADYRRNTDAARTPALLRPLPIRDAILPGYATIAYFVDVILPRDAWLHRHDIARATGSPIAPDPTDADVVAQVVRDLGLAWTGPDVVLELTGPEGGTWLLGSGADGPTVSLPAVEFMRHLSGRAVDADLFEDVPDSLRPALDAARVTF